MNNYNKNQQYSFLRVKKQYLQIFRGSLLAIQMCFAHYCFLKLGLIETSAIFAIGPIMVTALSIIFLHEKVDWQRILTILSGFIGILIILRPGFKGFDPLSILALACAISYATYQILTRYVSSYDSPTTSFLYRHSWGIYFISSGSLLLHSSKKF